MSSVIVIGGGHNGLVCAAHLAKSGVKVIVLEARDRLGGLAADEEFHPGYTVPGILHDTGHVRSQVVEGLDLAKHGLKLRSPVPIYAPGREGSGLVLHRDANQAKSELQAHSERDAAAYAEWREFLGRSSGFLASVLNEVPPPLNATTTSDFFDLGKRGLTLRRLGREHMVELMRVVPMCVADWLNELFETQLLSELLAGPAVYNTFMGPWSAGSAVNLLLDEAIRGQELVGGPSAMIESLTKAIVPLGVEVKTHARVQRIRVESGRVCGVTLDSGEDVDATTVISTCDPKQTLLELVDPISLTIRLEEQFGAVRARGTAAKVHLALSGPIEWKERNSETFEAVRIGGGELDELERAFDAVKYRRFSD